MKCWNDIPGTTESLESILRNAIYCAKKMGVKGKECYWEANKPFEVESLSFEISDLKGRDLEFFTEQQTYIVLQKYFSLELQEKALSCFKKVSFEFGYDTHISEAAILLLENQIPFQHGNLSYQDLREIIKESRELFPK